MATKIAPNKYRTQVLISKPGEKRKYKTFKAKTAREADMLAEQWKIVHLPNVKKGSFGHAAEEYLNAMKNTLSPSTLRSYDCIRKSIQRTSTGFYNRNMGEIRVQDFYPLYKDVKSPKTVRNWNGFISSVFAYKEVPMPKVKLPEKKKLTYHIPDEKELQAVLEAVKGTNLEIPVQLGMRGMRRGEISAVRSSDISGNVLHIQRNVIYTGSGYVEKSPKTLESDRYIPLPEDIVKKIKNDGKATDLTPEAITAAFRKMLARNGLPKFRFHDLRHAFVSLAIANNIPSNYVQQMGGWKTDHVMRTVYLQQLPSYAKKYQSQMECIFESMQPAMQPKR